MGWGRGAISPLPHPSPPPPPSGSVTAFTKHMKLFIGTDTIYIDEFSDNESYMDTANPPENIGQSIMYVL